MWKKLLPKAKNRKELSESEQLKGVPSEHGTDRSSHQDSNNNHTHWVMLVVDDEEEVHQSTEFALKGCTILDRSIKILHAYSASEAIDIIKNTSDIAIALLDVVMEMPDSGLKLVERIREMGRTEVRIILRTGQPGYAPELSVLRDYDINDYRTKSELTRVRLISLLTTAIRSYQQIHIINESRRGLALIIESSKDIFKRKNLELFAEGILTQLRILHGNESDGLVLLCNTSKHHDSINNDRMTVIFAAGKYKPLINRSLEELSDTRIKDIYEKAKQQDYGVSFELGLGLYFISSEGKEMFVFIESYKDLSDEQVGMIKIFSSNIAIAFENIGLVERLDQLAFIDPILKVPNRNAFDVAFQNFKETHRSIALVMVHVDSLSQLISVFGLNVVNDAIVILRERFLKELSPPPLFSACNGTEDILLLVDSRDLDINGMHGIIDAGIEVGNIQLPLSAKFSIVDVESDMDANTALRNAISTMVIAKRTPGNIAMHYNRSMTQGLTDRLFLQSSLKIALENGDGIEAYLQPKVDCNNGNVVGAEVLCRWTMDGRAIKPAAFIPIAEAGGLSNKITSIMLKSISNMINARKAHTHVPLRVAVNISMFELQITDFSKKIHAEILELDLSPETIEFEITETIMMEHPNKAIAELEALVKLGYFISIDDFGTGYSSLNYLDQLPVQGLKIDKTFIDALDLKSAIRSLAATSIAIAEKMGLTVVAEGIETEEQHEALKFLGCDCCQGFYFGRPVPILEFDAVYGSGPLPVRD